MRGPLPSTRVALPWWEEATRAALASDVRLPLPAAQWLAGRARRRESLEGTWRDWLLADTSLVVPIAAHYPAGPCIRALASLESRGAWAVATPVHLATAIDHLRLAPLHEAELPPEEADELLATVNAHLTGTGLSLEPSSPGAWSLRSAEAIDCIAHEPAPVVGRNVRDFLPTGRHGAAMRSLMNEIQMLLHDHPVNERRVRRGRLPVNSLWLWGFGALAPLPAVALPVLATDDPWLAGLWRRLGSQARPLGDIADILEPGAPVLVAASYPPSLDHGDALRRIDAECLEPLRRAVANGRCRALGVCTGGRVLSLDAAARWRFWRGAAPLAEMLS